jgi:transcriptional regulator with XRE-family HTH domain
MVTGGATLGEIITTYRLRKIHVATGRPWSQEDLAFAIGSGQAHISRIESNHKIPQYSTLVAICDALELSATERAHVVSSAGYRVKLPLPDEKAVKATLSKLASFMDSCPYPATLCDEGERIWYVNPVAAAIWGQWTFGADDHTDCNRLIRGKRVVELIFDPEYYPVRCPVWKLHYENADWCLDRNVTLFWRGYQLHLDDLEMRRVVERLKTNPDFARRWERLECGDSNLVFIEHASYTLLHPELGCLCYHAWRTRVMADERFLVTHCIPIDDFTSDVFKMLAQRLSGPIESPPFPLSAPGIS